MTWEWAVFLSVLMICGCAVFIYLNSKVKTEAPKLEELVDIQKQLNQIKADHETVLKLADEAKKLLSQSNLAMGFIPRAKRLEAK